MLPRRAVGAMRAERVVDVAHVHERARAVALARDAPVRVAAPVEHDVMLERHRGGEIELAVAREDQPRALHRVTLHHGALLVRQLARLVEDLERNARLPEIVQQSGHAERAHVARAHPHRLGQRHREHRDVERVRRRVLVELAQREQREEHLLVAVHRDGERAHDGFRLEQRQLGAVRDLLVHPLDRRDLLRELVAARAGGATSAAARAA